MLQGRPVLGTGLAVLVLSLGLVIVAPGGRASGAGQRTGDRAGFAEGFGLLWRSDADLNRELDGMAATGAKWLRVDVDWSVVERTPSIYDWSVIDRVITRARARGLQVLGMLAYTPAWARPAGTTDKYPPTDPNKFAAFARAAVTRYKATGVVAWEIWNEPNHVPFWQPAPNVAAYVTLLRASYTAIKAADPNAYVITGGLSPAHDLANRRAIAPATFVDQMYAAGAKGYFDAVGAHPSTYPSMPLRPEPDPNWNAFAGVLPLIRNIMVAKGDGSKLIWGTEMGSPTTAGHDATFLAAYLAEAYRAWVSVPWTGALFWYSYLDAGADPSNIEANFGLLKSNFTAKGAALSTFTSAMASAVP